MLLVGGQELGSPGGTRRTRRGVLVVARTVRRRGCPKGVDPGSSGGDRYGSVSDRHKRRGRGEGPV